MTIVGGGDTGDGKSRSEGERCGLHVRCVDVELLSCRRIYTWEKRERSLNSILRHRKTVRTPDLRAEAIDSLSI
jgi:hypothetical protein